MGNTALSLRAARARQVAGASEALSRPRVTASVTGTTWRAADAGRLFADWMASILHPDRELQYHLRALRARSRELVRNNDYVKGYWRDHAIQVIGAGGISFQARVSTVSGKPRKDVNRRIEAAFREWSQKGVCTVDGRWSRIGLEQQAIRLWDMDGECFIRFRYGTEFNRFGFAAELLDADLLDETFNIPPGPNGENEIRQGVEMNSAGRPVAYHFWRQHPDLRGWGGGRVRVPAEEVVHVYDPERAGQTRGVPRWVAAMADLHMLEMTESAYVVGMRVAASAMGYWHSTEPDQALQFWTEIMQKSDGKVPLPLELAAGQIGVAPPGYQFAAFDPKQPSTDAVEMIRLLLRGAAKGIGCSNRTLTGDLSDANYSSMRADMLPERDGWKNDQRIVIETLDWPLYRAWLESALLTGALSLDSRLASDYAGAASFQGRRWPSVNPVDDADAALTRYRELGITSRTRLAAEEGEDIDDIEEERRREGADPFSPADETAQARDARREQRRTDRGKDRQAARLAAA